MKKAVFLLLLMLSMNYVLPAYAQDDPVSPGDQIAQAAPSPSSVDCVATETHADPCPPATITKVVNGVEAGSVWGNVGWILFGLICYFTMQYKMKKWRLPSTDFNFGIWIKDNWPNAVLFLAAIFLYIKFEPEITSREAFMLGVAPNFLLDYMQKFFVKVSS